MSDRRRLVTLDAAGAATTVKDLETTTYSSVRKSTTWEAPPPNAIIAKRERRFGGSEVLGEHHDNGSVSWRMIIRGTSVDNLYLNVQTALQACQAPRRDLFFEWRADGATSSVFYDIGGPISWTPVDYDTVQTVQALFVTVDIKIPLKPLALLAAQTFTISSSTLPIVFAMTGIGGDTSALANVTLRTSGGAAAPIWALLGWAQHPTTPLASSVAPFGIIEAETGTTLVTWASVADANYRGGNGLRTATSGAGNASATFILDPSTIPADDFSASEVDIEIWARIEIASTVVSPVIVCGLGATGPTPGSSLAGTMSATPFGAPGASVVLPSSGTRFRRVRLGTISMPVDTVTPAKWNLYVAPAWATGSTGNFGLDYLELVPAKSRACSKTSVANDATYPDFIGTTADTSKAVMGADLSGMTGSAATNKSRDSGLGGSPIELPTGSVDMLLHLSSLVPGDPTLDATSEQISHTGVTGSVVVFPRVFWAKGQ